MIEYLKRYGMGLRFVNRKLWDDYEIVYAAATECGACLQFLPKNHQLLDNPIIGYQAVKSYEYAIAYLSDNLKNDKKILLRAIKSKYTSIPNNFRNDRDVIIQALSNFPSLNLEVLVPTLNDSIFDDEEIMLSIRRRVIDFCIMKRISERLKNDLNFFMKFTRINPQSLAYFTKFKDDIEILKNITKDYLPLTYVPHEWQSNIEIVENCLLRNGNNVTNIPFSLWENEDFIARFENSRMIDHILRNRKASH